MPRELEIRDKRPLDRMQHLAADLLTLAVQDYSSAAPAKRAAAQHFLFQSPDDLQFWCDYFDSITPEQVQQLAMRGFAE